MASAPASSIPTLTSLFASLKLQPPTDSLTNPSAYHNSRISLIRTDITTLTVDAIVNAANESLLGGGGVDGAIHRAAGPDLVRECSSLDGCETGSAKITAGYNLPAKRVIHAVGPIYSRANPEVSATLLRGCYNTSLQLAVQNDCKTVAFSALSTGIYGYPSEDAAQVAIETVRNFLDDPDSGGDKLDRIVFCSFLEKDERAYEDTVPKFFPPAQENPE